MQKQPTISQYLISTCLLIIDEFNELYGKLDKQTLKHVADDKFNEMDITVRLGYPFRQMVHYTVGDSKKGSIKSNHDLYIESKDFKIEVKYLKNWDSAFKTPSNSTQWSKIKDDFDWLFNEIDNGNKNKRAFVIGWFNCVDYLGQILQIGANPSSKPLADDEKICYFPFLRKTSKPAYTKDLAYNYSRAYEIIPVDTISEKTGDYNCIFVGNENDVFHFAIYY